MKSAYHMDQMINENTSLEENTRNNVSLNPQVDIETRGIIPPTSTPRADCLNAQELLANQLESLSEDPSEEFVIMYQDISDFLKQEFSYYGISLPDDANEIFTPYFVDIKNRKKIEALVSSKAFSGGFVAALITRPIIFFRPGKKLGMCDLSLIVEESFHARSSRSVTIEFDDNGTRKTQCELGIGELIIFEEALAHMAVRAYLNQGSMTQTRDAHYAAIHDQLDDYLGEVSLRPTLLTPGMILSAFDFRPAFLGQFSQASPAWLIVDRLLEPFPLSQREQLLRDLHQYRISRDPSVMTKIFEELENRWSPAIIERVKTISYTDPLEMQRFGQHLDRMLTNNFRDPVANIQSTDTEHENAIKLCPACGSKNRALAKFCGKCGAPLA